MGAAQLVSALVALGALADPTVGVSGRHGHRHTRPSLLVLYSFLAEGPASSAAPIRAVGQVTADATQPWPAVARDPKDGYLVALAMTARVMPWSPAMPTCVHMPSRVLRRRHTSRIVAAITALIAVATTAATARADTWTPPAPTYQLNDSAGGNVLSILPPGEHGLYNAADITAFQANGTRPAGADDQLPKYQNLLYNSIGLTDAQLPTYFNDESFGIPAGQIARTETPSASVPVVIYRDPHEVPHIYAADRVSLSFGAGYAAAEDRLFMMDVLRH